MDTHPCGDAPEALARRRHTQEIVREKGMVGFSEELLQKVAGETTRTSRPEVVDHLRRTALTALLLLVGTGCAGAGAGAPELIVSASTQGRGWPFGESGGGPVMTLAEAAKDRSYGWSPTNPVRLGGFDARAPDRGGDERQVLFLNSLWGPGGETLFYERIGTCCPFQLFGGLLDKGMLDVYALSWDGLSSPKHLYLDRYREGPVKVPVGLTTKIRRRAGSVLPEGATEGVFMNGYAER